MYLLVLVLNKHEHVNAILERFLEIGITGATLVDSRGMGREILECESPVVGGLRKLIYEQCHPNNITIFSLVHDEETIDRATDEIEKIAGDLDRPGAGVLFVLPVIRVKGLQRHKNE